MALPAGLPCGGLPWLLSCSLAVLFPLVTLLFTHLTHLGVLTTWRESPAPPYSICYSCWEGTVIKDNINISVAAQGGPSGTFFCFF